MKIIIITGDEPRHDFFRLYLSNHPNINVLSSFVEEREKSNKKYKSEKKDVTQHLNERESIENDFFNLYNSNCIDNSCKINLSLDEVNSDSVVNKIINLKPDYILTYGCSIIKSELIEIFEKRIINMHLGLSPYYRGSGTNIFPIYNNEIQFIGTTFLFMDKGIDTGPIIHQLRPQIFANDSHHQIGNRLIKDSVILIPDLLYKLNSNDKNIISSFPKYPELPRRHYKRKDFNNEIIKSIELKYLKVYLRDILLKRELN